MIGARLVTKRIIAPVRAIIQYVEICIFPILILGNKRIDNVTKTNAIDEIIIVGIINCPTAIMDLF